MLVNLESTCVVTRIRTGKVKILIISGFHTSSRIKRLSDKEGDRKSLNKHYTWKSNKLGYTFSISLVPPQCQWVVQQHLTSYIGLEVCSVVDLDLPCPLWTRRHHLRSCLRLSVDLWLIPLLTPTFQNPAFHEESEIFQSQDLINLPLLLVAVE